MYLVYNRLLSIIVIVRCHQETTILVGEHDAYVPQGFESPSTNVPRSGDNPSLVPSPHRSNKVDPNLNPLSSFSALDGRTVRREGQTEGQRRWPNLDGETSARVSSGEAAQTLGCVARVAYGIIFFAPGPLTHFERVGRGRAASLVLESRG